MNKTKAELRNELFEKYFEVREGIPLSDLMIKLKPITEAWQNLHKILEENIEEYGYDSYSSIERIKLLENKSKKYLIIKTMMWRYLIVDLQENKVINSKEIQQHFEEEFFVDNFFEEKLESNENYTYIYWFLEYSGNAKDLIDFYVENQKILSRPNRLYYSIKIGEAWTYLSMNLTNGKGQLGFQTPDQFLYEQLFFNSDLIAFGLQDAQTKIGIEKMKEMFDRIKDIKIPKEYIKEKLEVEIEYLENSNSLRKKLEY